MRILATMTTLFSAHAEVFPCCTRRPALASSLLRTRGGISSPECAVARCERSSPHTRRYFLFESLNFPNGFLFSAHAEVFPRPYSPARPGARLRTRGGISWINVALHFRVNSSPHTRRYFHHMSGLAITQLLFSAHAEVFLVAFSGYFMLFALLRTRGGISSTQSRRSG